MPLQHSQEHEEQPARLRALTPQEAAQEAALQSAVELNGSADVSAVQTEHPIGAGSNLRKRSRRTSSASSLTGLWQRFTRQQRILLMIPVVLYLLLTPITFGWIDMGFHDAGLTGILLYLIVPTVLSVYLGVRSKSRQVGALAGVLTGFMAVLFGTTHSTLGHHYTPPVSEQVNMLAQWLTAGAILGVGGAFAGSMVRRPRPQTTRRIKRRLRVRVVMENAE